VDLECASLRCGVTRGESKPGSPKGLDTRPHSGILVYIANQYAEAKGMTDVIDEYTRRPARYQHLDGTGDLGLGIWLLMFALSTRLSAGTTVTWYWLAVAYGMIGAVWAVVHFSTRFIRRRLVYPRAGYLAIRKRPWTLAFVALAGAVTAAAAALCFARAPSLGFSAPLIAGLSIGLAMLIVALRQRARKFAAYATLSVGIGLVLQFVDPTFVSGTFWYFFLMGTALVISGALTLYFYVCHTPRNPGTEK